MGYRTKISDIKDIVMEKMRIGKDYVVVITGDEGEGKSSVAIDIASTIDPEFDLWDNIIYTGHLSEYNEKYDKLKEKTVIILDEAIELMYKMDFMKTSVKTLVKYFAARQRKEKHAVYILNIPHMSDLAPYWREKRAKMWIELMQREFFKERRVGAIVFEKTRVPFLPGGVDTWLLKDFYKEWMVMLNRSGYVADKSLNIMRKHPYFMGELIFRKINKTTYAKYLACRERAYRDYKEEAVLTRTEKMWRRRFYALTKYLIEKYAMGQKEIEDNVGIPKATLSRGLERFTTADLHTKLPLNKTNKGTDFSKLSDKSSHI